MLFHLRRKSVLTSKQFEKLKVDDKKLVTLSIFAILNKITVYSRIIVNCVVFAFFQNFSMLPVTLLMFVTRRSLCGDRRHASLICASSMKGCVQLCMTSVLHLRLLPRMPTVTITISRTINQSLLKGNAIFVSKISV